MATYYTGYRNVLKGRDADDAVNPIRGKVGTYTYYDLYNSSHVLDGAPDKEIVLGASRPYSQPTLLELLYSGKMHHIAPLDNPGTGPVTNYWLNTTLFGGLESARALGDPGHAPRKLYYGTYTNWVFDGLTSADALSDPGHAIRYGVVSYGGAFAPYVNKGVAIAPLADPGKALATDATGLYGSNKVNEWRGVPSSQAL